MQAQPISSTAFEVHYTPLELAKIWKAYPGAIRRIFIDEPGVIDMSKQTKKRGTRDYVTLRIPASVAERVHDRRTR